MTIERMSVSYKADMKERLLKRAKEENRSLSGYVQNVLMNHLDRPILISDDVYTLLAEMAEEFGQDVSQLTNKLLYEALNEEKGGSTL